MDIFTIIGLIVVFFALVISLMYYFGLASFTFTDETTGKTTTFNRKQEK